MPRQIFQSVVVAICLALLSLTYALCEQKILSIFSRWINSQTPEILLRWLCLALCLLILALIYLLVWIRQRFREMKMALENKPLICPHCDSENVTKDVKQSVVEPYKSKQLLRHRIVCNDCERTFESYNKSTF